jgi:hypothetical protein
VATPWNVRHTRTSLARVGNFAYEKISSRTSAGSRESTTSFVSAIVYHIVHEGAYQVGTVFRDADEIGATTRLGDQIGPELNGVNGIHVRKVPPATGCCSRRTELDRDW